MSVNRLIFSEIFSNVSKLVNPPYLLIVDGYWKTAD